MRLIRITTNSPTYLQQFYASHPGLENQPYPLQYQTLMSDCYGWSDFWTHALRKLGYGVWEPIGNAEQMQKVWAKEHGIRYHPKTWLTDITMAQVKQFQPEVVFVDAYMSYPADFLNLLRRECPSIKLILGWCGAPYFDKSVFAAYDIVLSNIPGLVEHFQKNGHRSKYMRHAFEPRILDKIHHQVDTIIEFSFLGSIVKLPDFHNTRETVLRHLTQKTDLQIWSDTQRPSQAHQWTLPIKQCVYSAVQIIKNFPGGHSLLQTLPKLRHYANMIYRPELPKEIAFEIITRSSPPLYGLAMYQKLYDSRITLNTHIDLSQQYASNMRLYEATGVGTCLLTEWQPNLHKLFEPDKEVATYQHPEEAAEKIQYLLSHDDERRQIAEAGQQRTLRDHTFDIRAEELETLIRRTLKSNCS